MSNDQIRPDIFDEALVAHRRASASDDQFLLARCAADAVDRLLDVNRAFKSVLFIGHPCFAKAVLAGLPSGKIKAHTLANVTAAPKSGVTAVTLGALPYEPRAFDLIINALTLHAVNALPDALFDMRRVLAPDGLCLSALFGGQTLTELRQSLYVAEDALYGGITARISPMIDFSQAAAIMQQTGYTLPVVDTDRVNVNYLNPLRLLSDIKDMGDTNALTARSSKPVSRRFLSALTKAYKEGFSQPNGKVVATFEILWLTGWSPHESQQKPLRPGSAKTRLSDALGVKETKL